MLLAVQVGLGFIGLGARLQVGGLRQAIIVSLLTFGLVWATPRFRILNPIRAHWVNTTASRTDTIYSGVWSLYRVFERISKTINITLEGEGGIMWTLLFLVIFVSLLTQGIP